MRESCNYLLSLAAIEFQLALAALRHEQPWNALLLTAQYEMRTLTPTESVFCQSGYRTGGKRCEMNQVQATCEVNCVSRPARI